MEGENGCPSSKIGDYEVIEEIERGSFASKFLVLHRTENKKYVLKKITPSKQTDKFKRIALEEIHVLEKLRHPYIVEFKDAWIDEEICVYIITNCCERGDVSQIIRKARGAYFSEEVVCKWLTQMLLAIDYLHSNRVHHRELKLSSIHVTKENDIRLGDFGLARFYDEGLSCSADYMMPELIAGAPYSYKSDTWSLGCCIFEIAAHQQAFKASDMTGLLDKINRSVISPLPIVYSVTLKQIIKSMLRKSPEHRPTAAELLRQPHLQSSLLRCRNPSPTFLPVKSPSPRNANDKKHKTPSSSSTSSSSSKDKGRRETKPKPKPKELLPFFDAIKDIQVPSLLEAEISMDELLETKRVDPTSYSGKISTDSEDSKSGGEVESKAASSSPNVTSPKMNDMPIQSDDVKLKLASLGDCESTTKCREDPENKSEDTGSPAVTSNSTSARNCDDASAGLLFLISPERDAELRETFETVLSQQNEKPAPHRADALESLLELCADLLKQEKLDELNGILKPFGDETVSSRETAIWLSKSLMNAKKVTKDS